ncbi:MAG: copper chaperone PCu(A)C [Pseudomonadota bacterium]
MKFTATRIRSFATFVALLALGPLAPALAAVEASDGWSRETVPGTSVGVGYLTLTNTGTSRAQLLKITTPVADSVAVHQSSVDANGVAHMWPVASLELKPGEVMQFTPGGKHLMLVGLNRPLRTGDRIPLTMQFDRDSPPVTIILSVRALR